MRVSVPVSLGTTGSGRLQLSPWLLVVLLSFYIGVVLNSAVFARRFKELGQVQAGGSWMSDSVFTVLIEVGLVMAFTGLLLSVADLLGKWVFRTLASLLLIISVLASYYMTFFNVVIGYGVVQAVLTTDVDLSKEAVGVGLLLWFLFLAVIPLALWWRYVHELRGSGHRHRYGHGKTWPKRFRYVGGKVLLAGLFAVGCAVFLKSVNADTTQPSTAQPINDQGASQGAASGVGQDIGLASLAAHTYVPSNWVAGMGMSASNAWDNWVAADEKIDPAKQFQYSLNALDDVYLVVVIGESARSTNFGLLGYERPTTPHLVDEKNLVAFKGTSCNTSTKLSLQCMFVRPQGVVDHGLQAPKVLEENVFSVLGKLGFSIELFAMQSEVWFYNSIKSNFYKIREVIAAEPANRGKPVVDSLLEAELAASIANHTKGRHAIVLHTKGSHFSYTSRYPREFARYQPECSGVDGACSKAQLINSYDNSVLYTDTFLHGVMKSLADKKAILIYTSDHGESIDENRHFHATPKPLAPPEQLAVPLLFWASQPYLDAGVAQRQAFHQLQIAAQSHNVTAGHENLFDSMLGCLGVSSQNGGVNPKFNLCN